LVPGLVVPAGTRLVGRTFPEVSHLGKGSALAILLVTGAPHAVFDELLQETHRAGYTMRPSRRGPLCQVIATDDERWWLSKTRQSIEQPVPSGETARGLLCRAVGVGRSGDAVGRQLALELMVGADVHPTYVSHLTVEYQRTSSVAANPPTAGASISPTHLRPAQFPELPAAGEAFAASLHPAEEIHTVVPGSRILAPSMPLRESGVDLCADGGFYAVFEITGDVTTVENSYIEQVPRLHDRRTETVKAGATQVRITRMFGEGGLATVHTTIEPGKPSHLLFKRCAS
jgi:hypothetical protein